MQALRSIFVFYFLFPFLRTSTPTTLDTITPNRYIRDGESLVSAGGSFQLGFFSPGKSNGRYLGIWYSVDTEAVVCVANRETPLGDTTAVLNVTEQGVLVLLNSSNSIVWSSNSSTTAGNPVSQLLDSGNLVVKDGNETNPVNFLWQSFDYQCDTYLPEMKLGWDLVTGLERYVSSWRSRDDPAPGEFSLRIDHHGFPQTVVVKGAKIVALAGSWNGLHFTAYPCPPQTRANPTSEYEFMLNKDEIYYEYRLLKRSMFSRYMLNPSGIAQRLTWVHQTHSWELSSTFQADYCENYALCGAYASCNMNVSPLCACFKGSVPKSPKDWNSGYWSDGCVRKIPLAYSSADGFLKYTGVKLPDTSSSWFDKSMSLKECKGLCLNNCSCTAYANLDIREGGTGCLLWFGKLIDIREFTRGGGQDLYIRMASSELDQIEKKSKFNKKKLPGILLTSSALFLLGTLIIGLILYRRKKKLRSQGVRSMDCRKYYLGEDMGLPLLNFTILAKATNDFSSSNKLGEGGFGPVYKVTEIYATKAQNFFRSRETKVARLVYLLIGGIARGLLYLHQDSRLRIIHRDLKASNILLDNIMNPKISDFGLAKTFGSDQSQGNTKRVVGTYGYMSPEYAVDGNFSVKSDVFSFGVILLEMLSRQKNRGFSNPDYHLNLLAHAWILWIEDKPLELIDKILRDSCTISEVLRCLHVALLCVQRVPEDRPSMSSVILMLSSDVTLPPPKQPGFYTEQSVPESHLSTRRCSANTSITIIEAR